MALYLQIPVQRTCIHKIPVHGANIHSMDGNAGHFTYSFPSINLVYTKSPSNPIFSIQWTGNVTETARPTVRKPCIHESPV